MGKEKSKTGVSNKHLHARISYLQQAATYLTLHGQGLPPSDNADGRWSVLPDASDCNASNQNAPSTSDVTHGEDSRHKPAEINTNGRVELGVSHTGGLPLYLSTHLRQVALKSQIRLHTDVKHAICKRCSTVLVEAETCTKRTENLSRGGKKPHADVLVKKCLVCNAEKRFPIGARRQKRKTERKAKQSVLADVPRGKM